MRAGWWGGRALNYEDISVPAVCERSVRRMVGVTVCRREKGQDASKAQSGSLVRHGASLGSPHPLRRVAPNFAMQVAHAFELTALLFFVT